MVMESFFFSLFKDDINPPLHCPFVQLWNWLHVRNYYYDQHQF